MKNKALQTIYAFANQRTTAYQRVRLLTGKRAAAAAQIKRLCEHHGNLPELTEYLRTQLRTLCAVLMPPAGSSHSYWNQKINNILS